MKKIILLAAMAFGMSFLAGAQDTKTSATTREGNVFIQTVTKRSSDADQPTQYVWKDIKGNEYTIWLHTYTKGEKQGQTTCFVWRKSQKTGKEYKYYIPDGEKIAAEILKENQ